MIIGGGEDDDKRLRLQEETIFHLKQELASLIEEKNSTIFSLKERIEELKYENEHLRSGCESAVKEGSAC